MKLFHCPHCDRIFRSYKMYALHRYSIYNTIYTTTSTTNNSILNQTTFLKKIESYNTLPVSDSYDSI
jgi:hypothetical protein